ncbi:hypothetical protein C1752_00479 [Acaryochloris thomasi RCC1774]|uniref:Uncharacterized protein n=1 Tax=Acaryochloris thomasi RCC1774 TaxID=1764569 RepID=A0A2W1K2E0_9CYAN|nr:hypothetical protein C1752_00479 [Acaryochloris thomasi RCC1774]
MWESFVTQLFSFWVICCAFGCYFSLEVQQGDR